MTNFMLKSMSVKLLVTVIIVFKRYPSTHCLMQGRCFFVATFKFELFIFYLNIIITTYKVQFNH